MLTSLHIKNFILIDEITLEFNNGFSVFTGSTGAGKSIIVGALNLLSGAKAKSSDVRETKEYALIEGVFEIEDQSEVKKILQEASFDDSEIIISRKIFADGKAKNTINQRPVTVSFIKKISSLLIDIHSQHDNQDLLNSKFHLQILDNYIDDQNLFLEVKESYNEYAKLKKSFTLEKEKVYDETQIEFLKFQVSEIESANLIIGEDEELKAQEKQYQEYCKNTANIEQLLLDYQEIESTLYSLNNKVDQIFVNNDPIKQRFHNAYYEIADVMEETNNKFNDFTENQIDIDHISERLFVIQKLKRKYGNSIEEILTKYLAMQQELEKIANFDMYQKKMELEIEKAYQKYQKNAILLHELREKAANELELKVVNELEELSFKYIDFKIQLKTIEDSIKGYDQADFLISLNPGIQRGPLNKVASGGELSRIMLGLKVVFSKFQAISTIIFDEIDTGVSGKVASEIGSKMLKLSKNSIQVFSITHLAQVAACANNHYEVEKQVIDDRTITYVKELSLDQKIDALAGILSNEVTLISRQAAKELYEKSQL